MLICIDAYGRFFGNVTLPSGMAARGSDVVRRHVWITGAVQGVFFRESMRREADRVGAKGWVRNLPDGRVEAVIEGDASQVAALLAWSRRGPPSAEVEAVEERSEDPAGESGFRVLR